MPSCLEAYFSSRRVPILMLISHLPSDLSKMVIFGGAMKGVRQDEQFRCFSLFLINELIYLYCKLLRPEIRRPDVKESCKISDQNGSQLCLSKFLYLLLVLTYFHQDCKSWKTEHLIQVHIYIVKDNEKKIFQDWNSLVNVVCTLQFT